MHKAVGVSEGLSSVLAGKVKVMVGISDLKVSDNPEEVLITYSLGSCIGLVVYDPVVVVGGLLHYMLPLSRVNPEKAASNPAMFADTGIPLLFREVFRLGARRENLVVKAAGGASPLTSDTGMFRIGERNYTILRKMLWKNDILLAAEDIGGTASRTLYLEVESGRTVVRSNGREVEL